ncbi:MAG: hypothetical protein H6Q00_3340 [Holophagaceae bacterium]|nr:hypothetical protein [Holophagaceae bacterium]
MLTPSLVMWTLYQPSPLGMPSRMRACISSLASIRAAVPPALDSLMPPVRGLLAPADKRPELAAEVPVSIPGAKTSLLFGPRGWQDGGTSWATTVEVRARPPNPAQESGTGPSRDASFVRSTRRMRRTGTSQLQMERDKTSDGAA